MHLLLGSIGTISETSELQRECFNEAFEHFGLDWVWEGEEYAQMLRTSGGRRRIMNYAQDRGQEVDASAIHAHKSELFQRRMQDGLELRPGIADAIEAARSQGGKVALVTTTSADNVSAMLDAARLPEKTFDLITHRDLVQRGKPEPDAYKLTLEKLDIPARQVIAVEDNPDGFEAAKAAGLRCVAMPGLFHDASQFPGALDIVDTLEFTRYGTTG